MTQFRVIFDTDLGSDVDDALALATIWGSPEIALEAVTTVYGDTALRARLAVRYAALAGRPVTAFAGRVETLSGREVWWPGHEGTLHEGPIDEVFESTDAVDLLLQATEDAPALLEVIAVGPLTNIAEALTRDPGFATRVRHLWIMGGGFDPVVSEHNLRSDSRAAAIVFASGIPTTVIGLEATQRVAVRTEQLARVTASGALGAALTADIHQWWKLWNEEWNVPHDPLAVLMMLRPDLFTFSEPGSVSVIENPGQDDDGVARFDVDPGGSVRVVTGLEVDTLTELMIDRVVAAQVTY